AAVALTELEPRFVARLTALSCSSGDAEPALRAGLSSGPFAQKWGALPVALWLAADGPDALRRFVESGPASGWDLADRPLDAALRRTLAEAKQVAATCGPPS